MTVIVRVDGGIGNGKTLMETYLAVKCAEDSEDPRPVYSNYRIRHPKAHLIDPNAFLELKKPFQYVVVIDEAYAWADSRRSMTRKNQILSYCVFQSRKRGSEIIWSAQLGSTVENRLGRLSNLGITAMRPGSDHFRYIFEDIETGNQWPFRFPFAEAEQYARIFDTNEIVEIEE